MIRAARQLWAEHRLTFIAFLIAATLTVLFAVRSVVFTIYWADPAHHDQPIEGWMTPRYIANSYRVDPKVVGDALGLADLPRRRVTLEDLAQERGQSVQALAAILQTAVQADRAARGETGQ